MRFTKSSGSKGARRSLAIMKIRTVFFLREDCEFHVALKTKHKAGVCKKRARSDGEIMAAGGAAIERRLHGPNTTKAKNECPEVTRLFVA